MDDSEITKLFLQRKESAIKELANKYGSYCKTIAANILKNPYDADECLNDTYLALWSSIPPQNPKHLGAYAAKVVRNKALDLYDKLNSAKRGGGQNALPLDELGDMVSGSSEDSDNPLQAVNKKELLTAINSFLDSLSKKSRLIFVGRYWCCYSVSELAMRFCTSEHNITVNLSRTRKKLKAYLSERGYEL